MPHTKQKIIVNKYLVWGEFLRVDRLVLEGVFSISSQTSLAKDIYIIATDQIEIFFLEKILSEMAIFHELTDQSGRGYFLLLARLVWRGKFLLMPHTRYKMIMKKHLVWDEFLVVDRLVWEGGFSISSQTSPGKGNFTNTPDLMNILF